MKDPFDDPELRKYFRHAEEEMIPKLRESALSLTIFSGKLDAKICCELGAAILLDKPLIILVPDRDVSVPANLRRVASKIIYGGPDSPGIWDEIQSAVSATMQNDRRTQ